MHGIGGCTIAEAKRRISYTEYLTWLKYRNKRGNLNTGLRVERGSALVASVYANIHRKEHAPAFQLHDFAPYHDRPELTLEEAMKSWG